MHRDVEHGFVTRAAAQRDYGVIIGGGGVDGAATTRCRASRQRDNIRAEFDFGPEREAWEQVFDDESVRQINDRLYALPKSTRYAKRRWVYEQAVPELRSDDPLLLAEAMADSDAVRVRLRAALTAAFGNTV